MTAAPDTKALADDLRRDAILVRSFKPQDIGERPHVTDAIAEHIDQARAALEAIPTERAEAEKVATDLIGGVEAEPVADAVLWGTKRRLVALIAANGGMDHDDGRLSEFCDDLGPDAEDTFNQCHSLGWLRTTHNSDTSSSRVWLTDRGYGALYRKIAPEPELETTAEALAELRRAAGTDGVVLSHDAVQRLIRDHLRLLSALQSQPESGEGGR